MGTPGQNPTHMHIQFIEQQISFVFEVTGEYYRVSFERQERDGEWTVRLITINQNQTSYRKILAAIVMPDTQLAEEIVKTYLTSSK